MRCPRCYIPMKPADSKDVFVCSRCGRMTTEETLIGQRRIKEAATAIVDVRNKDADWNDCPEVFDVLFDRLIAALAAARRGSSS